MTEKTEQSNTKETKPNKLEILSLIISLLALVGSVTALYYQFFHVSDEVRVSIAGINAINTEDDSLTVRLILSNTGNQTEMITDINFCFYYPGIRPTRTDTIPCWGPSDFVKLTRQKALPILMKPQDMVETSVGTKIRAGDVIMAGWKIDSLGLPGSKWGRFFSRERIQAEHLQGGIWEIRIGLEFVGKRSNNDTFTKQAFWFSVFVSSSGKILNNDWPHPGPVIVMQ